MLANRAERETGVGQVAGAAEALELIRRCLEGDRQADRRFQDEYGELIYGYPVRVFRLPPESAGDFYVFALDGGRIYRRLRTFEGRAPLRAYLLGFVLDDLVLEWKRGEKEVETVSIEAMGEMPAVPSAALTAGVDSEQAVLQELLSEVSPAKAVVMKLLHIEDYELTGEELRHLAELSGRDVRDVMADVNDLRSLVREREATLKQIEDDIEGVHAWIQLYERRLRRVAEDLAALPPNTAAARKLHEERAELTRKIAKRREQHARLIDRAQRRKVTAPYKSIAAILNTTVGNVGSQIARLRQELGSKAEELRARRREHSC